jgi:trehalose 6-phosphate synthase
MRLSLRFILPLFIVLAGITWATLALVDNLVVEWFVRDVEVRARFVAHTMEEPITEAVRSLPPAQVRRRLWTLFRSATKDERLYAVAYCSQDGTLVAATEDFPPVITCARDLLPPDKTSAVLQYQKAPVHVSYIDLGRQNGEPGLGSLILVHDMSYVARRSSESKRYVFYFFAILGVVISFLTVVIAQLSWRGWISGMRAVLRGEGLVRPFAPSYSPELKPIVKDLRALVRNMEAEKAVRDEAQISWTPKALKDILQYDLAGEEVLIVSNREPYLHVRKGDRIEVQFPASGLVSALEPVMRACSGVWVAHGSGSADRETVDQHDRVRVPPDNPAYQIRRVWLSEEEEKGYYYGFSNEGLWPLCHVAHTRPVFRTQDWEMYVAVNQKFANTIFEESRTENPVILVQDYHFALLPRMIRQRLPRATVITFWHIPWPNPEAFGICPWREEILHGLLGSSILGFHTRFHCNNFIEAVDRFMETRIDRESSTITHAGHVTAVRNYPISIEWPSRWLEGQPSVPDCRRMIREKLGIDHSVMLAVGVDRLDYTKGILERFAAVERLLELEPRFQEKFAFVQIASPSRSIIEHYQNFELAVRQEADRINQKFSVNGFKPIHLLVEHHTPRDVFRYYRGAEVCFVSSLHDGMNLVAKEYVAAHDDEQGVLILSQFTGASRELPEALIVNPYDTDQCAAALLSALEMPAREQRERMRSMRYYIAEFNVYRWAGRMLMDAARMRQRGKFRERPRFGL